MSRPKKEFSKLNYCQYLLSSQTNYTLTNYAEHVAKVSYDLVNCFLATERLTASDVWREVKNDIVASESGYVVFDDTVLDKEHSTKIDSVRWQHSGNAHKGIRGIGLLNCVYVNPDTEQFHREIKQLIGIEKCQCRKQRIQRNHIACAIQVWGFLKRKAYQMGQTVYQLKKNLLKDCLTKELAEPQLKFSFA